MARSGKDRSQTGKERDMTNLKPNVKAEQFFELKTKKKKTLKKNRGTRLERSIDNYIEILLRHVFISLNRYQ